MTPTDAEQEQRILDAVASDIREVIGEDWIAGTPITMQTSFANELEIESVEMVALAERLHARFGEQLDLAAWLASREMEELFALTVGDLVRVIAERA